MRLQKHTRLLNAADFDRVFEQPIRSGDHYFTVLVRPNNLGHARLGLIVSKKKVRHASSRNRIKRIIREKFRLALNNCQADYIVLASYRSAITDNTTLFNSLDRHWKKIKQQCEKL